MKSNSEKLTESPIEIEGLTINSPQTEDEMIFCLGWAGAIMQTMEKEEKIKDALYSHLSEIYTGVGKRMIELSPFSVIILPTLLGGVSALFLFDETINGKFKKVLSLKESQASLELSKLTKEAKELFFQVAQKTRP